MSFRYNPVQRIAKKIFRIFFPVQKSAYTLGEIDDICTVELVPPKDLIEFFTRCIVTLKDLKGDDIGDYLEFGVFNGSSIGSMYLAAKKAGIDSHLYGFDAFEGLPEGSENEDDGVWKKGFYTCSYEKMRTCLQRRDINPDNITWINGWYKDTLNKDTIEKNNIGKLGIIFIDCDTYSSSKSVLDFIAPLINEPVIICFDDWKLNDLDIKGMGEYKSANEFFEENSHLKVTEIKSYNRKSKSFLVQP